MTLERCGDAPARSYVRLAGERIRKVEESQWPGMAVCKDAYRCVIRIDNEASDESIPNDDLTLQNWYMYFRLLVCDEC